MYMTPFSFIFLFFVVDKTKCFFNSFKWASKSGGGGALPIYFDMGVRLEVTDPYP